MTLHLPLFCYFCANKTNEIHRNMLQKLKQFKERHPFTSLMLIAIAVRVIVVLCVPGFGSNRELQHPTLFIGFLEDRKSVV